MEEIGNNNPAASESFTNIPAPTAEVKVRTMRSDLMSLAATGGGMPRFNKVNVEGLSISRMAADGAGPKKSSKPILVFLIVCVACAVLAAVGWLGYSLFFNKGSAGQQNASQPNSNSGMVAVQTYQPVAVPTSTPFTHASLFKKPVDPTITFSLPQGGAAETANDLQTYDQQVLGVLTAVNKNANFIEIDVKGTDGNDLSIEGLLSEADVEVLGPNFLAAHFNPDATFFAYKDGNDFWPGYVIALRQGENQLLLKGGVQAIESSPKIGNIFLAGTGVASPSGFTDAVIASTTVRVLNFTGTTPASFVYGWFQNYLIISASQNGFAQAIARLQ
jgi:hypothetical protein